MVVVSRSVHIQAPVDRVFALMADPAARAALNPFVTPIRVETEDNQPLHVGSICHFRLQTGHRIVDYRTRVFEFEPNRCIASVSDSTVPFEIRLETRPEGGGTRLTQTETFEPTDEMLEQALPESDTNATLRLAYRVALFVDLEWARRFRRQQEEALTRRLETNMDRWLEAIRAHLETTKD